MVFILGPGFARTGRTNGGRGHQVVGGSEWVRCGGGRYKRRVSGCGRVIVYSMAVPFFFECVYKRLPGVTQNQAVFPVHVIWMHLYFNGLPDETIPVSCFCREKFGVL